MLRKHTLAAALGLLAVIGAVEMAHARQYVHFVGTRGQVAAACYGPNRDLMTGIDHMGIGYSICVDYSRGTTVVCGDEGSCIGVIDKPTRPAAGPKGGPRGGRVAGPPQSLSGPVDGPAEAPATSGQTGDDVVIIY